MESSQEGEADASHLHAERLRAWIPYDVFLQLERDWNKLPVDSRGFCRKEALLGATIGAFRIDERLSDLIDNRGQGNGMVSLQDCMRELYPKVSKWDVRRFFVTEIPEDQLLALKGSLGQHPTARFLPKDAKHFHVTFDSLTQHSAYRLSLNQVLSSGESLGNMKFTVELFTETAKRYQVPVMVFRATFWEVVETLFPRVPPAVIHRYQATTIRCEDIEAFFDAFQRVTPADPSAMAISDLRSFLRAHDLKCLTLPNMLLLDTRLLTYLDKAKTGKVFLFDLIQSFYPNVPGPNIKRALAKHTVSATAKEGQRIEHERKEQLRLPIVHYVQTASDRDTTVEMEYPIPESNDTVGVGTSSASEATDDTTSTMSEVSVENEENQFQLDKTLPPTLKLLSLMYPKGDVQSCPSSPKQRRKQHEEGSHLEAVRRARARAAMKKREEATGAGHRP
eukprot:Sspe_Gene.61573::Locus_34196_Transcript_1_1_Confidence_1.000_Length_1432::g.61573::m.61573